MPNIGNKSVPELRNLAINKVKQNCEYTLRFNLNDGQSCKAGPYDCTKRHTFDPSKKITKVEVIIRNDEFMILRINFYHHGERLAQVEFRNNEGNKGDGRVIVFSIGDDYQLIGCKLDRGT